MTSFRNYVQPSHDAEFPAEKGRYHLYVTLSCPYACRALAVLYMKGLDDVVGVSVAHPIFQFTKPDDPNDQHKGWTFVDPAVDATFVGATGDLYPTTGCSPDPVHRVKYVRDLYELVTKEPMRYTVPLLWDKKKDTIVCNESTDLVRMFNSGFGDLVTKKDVDVLPPHLLDEIEAMNNGLLEEINTAFYKAAFLGKPEIYDQQLADVFAGIAEAEELLAKQRYLVGDQITECDIRLFHTLLRFDYGQREGKMPNLKDFPNIVNYLRELRQHEDMKRTVNEAHLQFMLSNYGESPIGPPTGPYVDYLTPHNRNQKFEK
uniref:GST C-terminal domain-containing protein n=1 Tax=Globisporangium ultimum (strain ATCC 200006 / CBS 805.95 / DAOM BR144) TaxID=431595 RepID=K3X4Y2_GLOUD